MKTLRETIKESIFDKNLATDDEKLVVKAWLDMYMPERKESWGLHWNIDTKNKTITAVNVSNSELCVDATDQKFTGFDIKGYKFLTEKGRPFTRLMLVGDIESLKNIPEGIEEISIFQPKDLKTKSEVFDDISKQLKRLKSLTLLCKDWDIGWKEVDLSDLKIPVTTLHIATMEDRAPVKFNPDTKVEILQIGYGAIDGYFVNLPIFKTISFKSATFDSIKELIEGLKDKGKSNFDKIIVNCRDLNAEEKESVKSLLKGEDSGFEGYSAILKKIQNFNSNQNLDDPTKDLFGCPLQVGDVVLVADTANPRYPSILDVYKGVTSGGRVRTEKRMQIPPRNVIKFNNPKILELLK